MSDFVISQLEHQGRIESGGASDLDHNGSAD
jgi:hypothetical protein